MQAFEYLKDPIGIFRVDPDTMVTDREDTRLAIVFRRNVNLGWFIPGEFDRVLDQVLKHARKLDRIGKNRRKRVDRKRRPRFHYYGMKVVENVFEDGVAIGFDEFAAFPVDP